MEKENFKDLLMKKLIKVGSQFSGVGAFDMALKRLNIDFENVYQAEWDKYARQTYLLNNEAPTWYVHDVYDTPVNDIPQLDIAMFSPPCQSFSLAGKREGENSDKGVLFYNSHEFIRKNKPRYFIFENVKGLLSDDGGKTFQRWIDYLGGKSVNGNPVIFPHDEATPYHVYYQVLNAKHYGVPQNRERIFIVGIRDDADNEFSFPKPFHLVKRLRDVLEPEVDEKYFLSEKMVAGLIREGDKAYINQNTQASQVFSEYGESPSICAGTHGYANGYVELSDEIIQLNDPKHSNDRIYSDEGISPTLNTMQGGNRQPFVQISSNTIKGYDIAEEEEDSINFSNPNSETRRGRVGKGVAQTLDTGCNQGVLVKKRIRKLTPTECFRLMDFNENFQWNVSDSQAYKQAGNSIVVNCLVEIIKKLKL